MAARDTSVLYGLGRGGLWIAVAAAHVTVLYAASHWSVSRPPLAEPTPVEAILLTEAPAAPETPSLPAPRLATLQPPVIEPPVVQLPAEASNAITMPIAHTPASPPPAPRAASVTPRVIEEVAYIQAPQPRYPPESRRSREEGVVVLRVLIDELGRAAEIEIHRSSGHARLDEAARVAVANALFRPYVENGLARPALVMIPIEFALRRHGARRGSHHAS